MCCVVGKTEVDFPITRLASGRLGDDRHVLLYGNTIVKPPSPPKPVMRTQPSGSLNLNDWVADQFGGLNVGGAMWIQVPARPGSVKLVRSAEGGKKLLEDLTKIWEPPVSKGVIMGDFMSRAPAFTVQDYNDVYTVALVNDLSALDQALAEIARLHPRRVPAIDSSHVDLFQRGYPAGEWTHLICGFDPDEVEQEKLAAPIIVTYDPSAPSFLYLPMLDQHKPDQLPQLEGKVDRAHLNSCFVHGMQSGQDVASSVSNMRSLGNDLYQIMVSARKVLGGSFYGQHPQGDMWVSISDLVKGRFTPKFLLPPGLR